MLSINKIIRAVKPYAFCGKPSFKQLPYDAWVAIGGKIAPPHYPLRLLHGLAYRYCLPRFGEDKAEARLRFVEPVALSFDTFPDCMRYEVIPMVWDCWPVYYEKVVRWFRKYHVRTAIFTSSQTAALMQREFPDMNILSITEGINVGAYHSGEDLTERGIDLLEYGSIERNFFRHHVEGVNHVNCENANGCMDSFAQLTDTVADAKITIALPRCDSDPESTGGIETLTQRFWECMLSRTILLGRAPKELVDLIGYNPVIELDRDYPDQQVREMVSHISDYQDLVNKNRDFALKMAPWEIRMKKAMEWLGSLGYEI